MVINTNDTNVDSGISYSSEEIKELICVVLDETYVQFGGRVFRQTCGVPMGGNASPLVADLVLTMMEYQFVKNNVALSKRIVWSGRYIDDILVANCPEFQQLAKEIYPAQLTLKQTNSCVRQANFLDLAIHTQNGLNVSVYNKTDDFSFRVVRYCFADSNVHANVGLGIFYSQLIRFARVTNQAEEFERRVSDIFMELLAHGFDRNRLVSKYFQFVHKSRALLCKFGWFTYTEVLNAANRIFGR